MGKGGLGWTGFSCSVVAPFHVSKRPPGDASLSISIYKSSQGCKKVRLQHFFTPEKSTVMSLACTAQSLYAGLVNGAVAVYARADGECPGRACAEVSLLHLGWGWFTPGQTAVPLVPATPHPEAPVTQSVLREDVDRSRPPSTAPAVGLGSGLGRPAQRQLLHTLHCVPEQKPAAPGRGGLRPALNSCRG